jgi:hypothetical protein
MVNKVGGLVGRYFGDSLRICNAEDMRDEFFFNPVPDRLTTVPAVTSLGNSCLLKTLLINKEIFNRFLFIDQYLCGRKNNMQINYNDIISR